MTHYHKFQRNVNLVLALLAALIVAAYDRRWLARPVSELIPQGSGIRLDWLCHLKARILGALTLVVERALTRGRPPSQPAAVEDHALEDELERVGEQYRLQRKAEGKRKANERLVEAYRRLKKAFGVNKKYFCARIGIAERSLRFWFSRALRPAVPASPPEPPAERLSKGQGRFGLERTLPGLQQMADTTDWTILGVPLKVMAVQDPGNRHREILSAVAVAEAESGQQIIDLVDQVAPPGTQVITDRGTPYMSQGEVMAQHEQEHAPCKEYTATEKATLERGFGIVKQALAPLVDFLDHLVEDFPGLGTPMIAVKLASLLLAVFLDVYRSARHGRGHPLEGNDPDVLRCIAEEQREKARSDQRSKLSTLERIHAQYAMPIGKKTFIRTYRSYALEDIVKAERRMRPAALRDDLRYPHRYFAAVINDVAEEGRERRRRERLRRETQARLRHEQRKQEARIALLHAHPPSMLHEGLAWAAAQWRADHWLFGNFVCGQSSIRFAVETMADCDPLGFEDDVHLECRRWHENAATRRLPLDALLALIDPIIDEQKARLRSD